jgi:hypothetical protein
LFKAETDILLESEKLDEDIGIGIANGDGGGGELELISSELVDIENKEDINDFNNYVLNRNN